MKIQVTGLYGEASAEVAKSLGLDSGENHSVWLPVNLQQDSAWKQKVFAEGEWQPGENANAILYRAVQVKDDEQGEVVLRSP